MVKRKVPATSESDVEMAEDNEVLPVKTDKGKKKKRKELEPVEVETDEPTTEDVVEVNPKQKKKKKKLKKIHDDEEISDIEKRYITAVRVKVDDHGDVFRLKGPKANIENKVFDLPEEDFNPKDEFCMPPSGILTDGVPFHHAYAYPLKKPHIQRLYAHGITIRETPFSPGEDDQIIENWRRFAKKFNLDYEDAPLYCGWAKHLHVEMPMHVKTFHIKTKFLAYMCAGLMNRTALQVYRRCYRIFDPSFDTFGRAFERPWTLEEEQKLQRLYEIEGPSWQKIALQMGRNRFQCQLHYNRVLCGHKPAYHSEKPTTNVMYMKEDDFRDVVYEHAKNYLPAHPLELVIRGTGEQEEKNINWHRLCNKYPNLTLEKCQAEWNKIKSQLRGAYNRANDPAVTFNAIEKAVFVKKPQNYRNFKPKIAAKAYRIMRDLAEEQNITEIYEIDVVELTNRLKAAELEFSTIYTLGSYVIKIAHKILITLRRNDFLRILPVSTTVIDLIEMIAYFMTKSRRKITFTKRECFKLVHRFLEHKKWKPNPMYEIIDRDELAAIEELRIEDLSDYGDDANEVNESESENEGEASQAEEPSADDQEEVDDGDEAMDAEDQASEYDSDNDSD